MEAIVSGCNKWVWQIAESEIERYSQPFFLVKNKSFKTLTHTNANTNTNENTNTSTKVQPTFLPLRNRNFKTHANANTNTNVSKKLLPPFLPPEHEYQYKRNIFLKRIDE